MRYILNDDVELDLPHDWEDRVTAARQFVDDQAAAAREEALAKGASAEEGEKAALKAPLLATSRGDEKAPKSRKNPLPPPQILAARSVSSSNRTPVLASIRSIASVASVTGRDEVSSTSSASVGGW